MPLGGIRRHRHLLRWILALALVCARGISSGIEDCYHTFTAMVDLQSVEAFESARNVLFLSDGAHSEVGLAERVAARFPHKEVVKTDIEIDGHTTRGNFTMRHADNRKELPFSDNSYSLIVMRRGLCLCGGGACCGGVTPELKPALNFLREVARVLDKNDPKAVAYLEGTYGNTHETIAVWQTAVEIMSRENPDVEVSLLRSTGGIFRGVKIRSRQPADRRIWIPDSLRGDLHILQPGTAVAARG